MLPSPIWGCDRSDKTNMYGPGSFMFSAVREVQRRSTGDSQEGENTSYLDGKACMES